MHYIAMPLLVSLVNAEQSEVCGLSKLIRQGCPFSIIFTLLLWRGFIVGIKDSRVKGVDLLDPKLQ